MNFSNELFVRPVIIIISGTIASQLLFIDPALSEKNRIVCSGIQIDVDVNPKADFPLAVVYDAKGDYTCVIDRGHAGHDPFKPCGSGSECRFIGTYDKKIGNTYYVNWREFCDRGRWVGETACEKY